VSDRHPSSPTLATSSAEALRWCAEIDNGERAEWQTARNAFTAFGAKRWAQKAERLITQGPPTTTTTPTTRAATATFTCDGDTRTVSFGDRTTRIHDLKGFRYLERLLADPAREFHVLDLVAVERARSRPGPNPPRRRMWWATAPVPGSLPSTTRPATPTGVGWPRSTRTSKKRHG
jgi:hypothetical protein